MKDGKKVSLHHFRANRIACLEKMLFWAAYSMSNKFLIVARHTLTTGLQKCL